MLFLRAGHKLLRESRPKSDVLLEAKVVGLEPAAGADHGLGAGSGHRVRYGRAEQSMHERSLLEVSAHQLAKHVGWLRAEPEQRTVPRLMTHLILALGDGHLERSCDGQQTAWMLPDKLMLLPVQVLLELVERLSLLRRSLLVLGRADRVVLVVVLVLILELILVVAVREWTLSGIGIDWLIVARSELVGVDVIVEFLSLAWIRRLQVVCVRERV